MNDNNQFNQPNMKKLLLTTILIALSAMSFGQEVETVSERFHYRYLKKEQTELSPDGYKAKERDLNE